MWRRHALAVPTWAAFDLSYVFTTCSEFWCLKTRGGGNSELCCGEHGMGCSGEKVPCNDSPVQALLSIIVVAYKSSEEIGRA